VIAKGEKKRSKLAAQALQITLRLFGLLRSAIYHEATDDGDGGTTADRGRTTEGAGPMTADCL
jgi:hypothetical protein